MAQAPVSAFIVCSSCQVKVTNTERTSHYRSDWHRYNVKRRCVNMAPIPKDLFEEKLAAIISRGQGTQYLSKSQQKRNFNQLNARNELLKNDQWNHSHSHSHSSNQNLNEAQSLAETIKKQQKSNQQFGLFENGNNGNNIGKKKLLFNFYCKLCRKSFKTQQQIESHLNTKKHSNLFKNYKEMLYIMQDKHARDAVSNNENFKNKNKKNKNKKNKNKNKYKNKNKKDKPILPEVEDHYIDDIIFESDPDSDINVEVTNIINNENNNNESNNNNNNNNIENDEEFENELANELAHQPGAHGNKNNVTPNGGKKGKKNKKNKNKDEINDASKQYLSPKYKHLLSPKELGLTEKEIFLILNSQQPSKTIQDNPFCEIRQIDLGAQKERNGYRKKLINDAMKSNLDSSDSDNTTTIGGAGSTAYMSPTKRSPGNNDITMEGVITSGRNANDDNNDNDSNDDNSNINEKDKLKEEIKNDFVSIPVRHCLFCNCNFDCLEDSMSHMTEKHGFFIPFEKRLKSLHGLLLIAGKLIGKKHQCVWCWKIFKSLKGCQMHTRHNGHCKLQLDHGSYIPRLDTINDDSDDTDGITTQTGIENEDKTDDEVEINNPTQANDNEDTNNNDENEVNITTEMHNPTEIRDNEDEDRNEDNTNEDDNGGAILLAKDVEEQRSYLDEVITNVYLNPNGQSPFAQYFDWDMANTSVALESSPGKPKSMLKYEREYNPRTVSDINEYNELIRADGTTIGHRNYKLIYKQRLNTLHHETQTEEQLISQINNPNKKFKLQEMIKQKEKDAFENTGGNEAHKAVKKQREDAFINLNTRSHKMGINQFKSQNRMLY